MAKKITQYPASGGNPEGGSLIDISELISGVYTSKKLTIDQLLDFLTANLQIGSAVEMYNNTGATIVRGTPIQVGTGVTGLLPNLKKVSSSDALNDGKIFIANSGILNGSSGYAIESGLMQFPSSFLTGDKLFWDLATEDFTTVSTNEDQIFIGIVILGHPLSAGKIFVAPRFSPSLVKGTTGEIPLFLGERKVGSNTHFTFVDNVGTEVGFTFDDGANNITKVGVTYINVESEGIASNSVLRLANWADNTNKGIVSFRKSRGTKALPTKVLTNDVLGSFIFTGQAEKIIDGGLPIASGMTTGEIILRGLQDFTRNFNTFDGETNATGGTQFEIWLQENNGLIFGDATPSNIKVFTVNGNGSVRLRNDKFKFDLNSFLQAEFKVGGTSSTASFMGYSETNANLTLQSVSKQTSFLISAVGDLFYPSIQFSKQATGGNAPYLLQTMLKFQTEALDFIEVIASEDHDITSHGAEVIFRTYTNLGFGSAQTEVLRLTGEGKLKINNAYSLPLTDGTNGQFLQTNGAGVLSWGSLPTTTDLFKLSPTEIFRGLSFNNNSTTVTVSGGVVASTSASTLAKSVSSTNLITKNIGLSYYASVVSTGRYTGTRGTANLWFIGGGFRFVGSFNISDTAYNAGCRQFYGMQGSATTADLTYNDTILVASLQNCIGVGSDALDANLQIFRNDATGTCTKIDLGSGFPANRTAGAQSTTIYEVQLYNPPAQNVVYYRVENKETGAIATGSVSTDLPLTTQGLNFFASRCMGTAITNSGQFILTGQFGVYSTN